MNREIPIALFAYNRLELLMETCKALQHNFGIQDCILFIFCDGPKLNANSEELKKINNVREYVKQIDWCKEIKIILRDQNLGLATSITTGVTELLNSYHAVIVLEDDIKTSPYFIKYMKTALALYEDTEEVISVTGFNYPFKNIDLDSDTFFIRGTECWGWGTWKRGWGLYNNDGNYLLQEIINTNQTKIFNFNNTYNYFAMLKKTIVKNNSWAVKWYASAFLKGKLTLYPKFSLVENIGNQGENNNVHHPEIMGKILLKSYFNLQMEEIHESEVMRKQFELHFRKHYNLKSRIYNYFFNRK